MEKVGFEYNCMLLVLLSSLDYNIKKNRDLQSAKNRCHQMFWGRQSAKIKYCEMFSFYSIKYIFYICVVMFNHMVISHLPSDPQTGSKLADDVTLFSCSNSKQGKKEKHDEQLVCQWSSFTYNTRYLQPAFYGWRYPLEASEAESNKFNMKCSHNNTVGPLSVSV